MAITSAAELLARCLAGESVSDTLLLQTLNQDEGRTFFSVVVERLADLFEPRLCDVYARLFARVLALARPEHDPAELVARYQRVRSIRRCVLEPQHVFVLSRVTLGADIAVTSVLLDAAKRRFPDAAIWFVGSRKNYELFSEDSRVTFLAWPYPRSGSLRERLETVPRLPDSDAIVIDTDSRLTQLGMLPIFDEDRYFLFESRSYSSDSNDALPVLAARWAGEVFGVKLSRAYLAPARAQMPFDAAVSFGVGDNPAKRIGDPFEREVLRTLAGQGLRVVLDKGAGAQETAQAERLAAMVPGVALYGGPYAPFASMISQARLFVGYDSAGQHVAAASATPLVSVFAGYPCDRFFARWSPHGRGPAHVVKVVNPEPERVIAETIQYLIL